MFVFAVEISLESEDADVINWVKSFEFEVDDKIFEPVELFTTAVNRDRLMLFFKKSAITEIAGSKLKLSCIAQPEKFFAAQKYDVEIEVVSNSNVIEVSVGKETRKIMDGDPRHRMGPIRDNINELHYYLGVEMLRDTYIVARGKSMFLQIAPEKRGRERR